MADDKLKSFKIQDTQAPRVESPSSRKADKAAVEPGPSLGFARIEDLLDNEDRESMMAKLTDLKTRLADLEKSADTHRDRAFARKAAVAVTHTEALMAFLYETKSSMEGK